MLDQKLTNHLKIDCFTFSPYKIISDQIWPCRRNRSRSTQGHHLNKLGSTRAPDAAYYQVSRSSAFWFRRRFLTCMGMATILVMWPGPVERTFVPPSHGGSIWNLTLIGPVVFDEMFENVDTHTYIHTNIRKTEAYLSYKLTTEPLAHVN